MVIEWYGQIPETFILKTILGQLEIAVKSSPKYENVQQTVEKLLSQDQREITMKMNVVERQIRQLENERKECWRKCEDGILNLTSGGKAYREIEESINQLKNQLTQLRYEKENYMHQREMTSDHRKFISDFIGF